MSNRIKVAVAGAAGRMGKEVVKLVLEDPDLELAAAVNRSQQGTDAGTLVGLLSLRGPSDKRSGVSVGRNEAGCPR